MCIRDSTYILMDDEIKEAIVIDPAGSPEEIIKFLENEGYSLDGVLLTHGHHDHIGGLSLIHIYTGMQGKGFESGAWCFWSKYESGTFE